jgi:succinylarginine dihydrolase
MPMREYNFDGLVGPTHNYAGLAPGNLASARHEGQPANPREAALQGLAKMRFVFELGAGQAVLPPQPRPSLTALRALGFVGSDEEVIARAARENEHLLRLCSSAASMWAANACTSAPSADTADGRVHITPANLKAMFHRAVEAETTYDVLCRIFSDRSRFAVHRPLPGGAQFADEGAANHTRLSTPGHPAVHLFAWGRSTYRKTIRPQRFPARQTEEGSAAVARLHQLDPSCCIFVQQSPQAIDAGAFHTDVLAVGNEGFWMMHEHAFADPEAVLGALREKLGPDLRWAMARDSELSLDASVAAYPFNSQVLTVSVGAMAIVAPAESERLEPARHFLERVIAEDNPVTAVHFLDVRQSMRNGGGPACLRQRLWLTDEEVAAVRANVFYTPALHDSLDAWIRRHYRDRLLPGDLADPQLARESMRALDELTRILELGSVFDFQQASPQARSE